MTVSEPSRDSHRELRLVDGYLDDELDADERLAFESHLEKCAMCRSRLSEGLAVRGILGSHGALPDFGGSGALWRRIEPRLVARPAGIGLMGWSTGALLATTVLVAQAAILLLAGLGLAGRLGAPVGDWMPEIDRMSSVLGAMEAFRVPQSELADISIVALTSFVAWLSVVALALAFFGWMLAERRRGHLGAGGAVNSLVLG
jgi:anti-sigma factor RsiW